MNFKTFWKESPVAFILKRILLALLIFVVLAWSTLILLDVYTQRGKSVPVPDVRGLYVEEAYQLLSRNELYALVIDSVYDRDRELGTIIDQIPSAQSSVKKNRSIFLVVNKRQVRMIPIPDVHDVSYRQADALLKSLGLQVSGVQYRPSEFKDLVIDVQYKGMPIEAGTRLAEGSAVVLIIGSGVGEFSSRVPSLIGMTLQQARQETLQYSFIIGGTSFDTPPGDEESQFQIFRQVPAPGQNMPEGTRINLWLTKDKLLIEEAKSKLIDGQYAGEEEEFF